MPEAISVDVHHGIADVEAYLCRLLRKVQRGGQRAVVRADAQRLRHLDELLWTFAPGDFVTHAMADAAPTLRARSTAVLIEEPDGSEGARVLINLGADVPAHAAAFERLIDLVGTGESERQQARRRWKDYLQRGWTPSTFDASRAAAPGAHHG